MSTTLSLTLIILGLIISFTLLTLTRRSCPTCELLKEMLKEEKTTNKALLGLPAPTETMSLSVSRPSSPEPESDPLDEFESLSPEIQETLLREYQEHLSQYPKNIRENPAVPSITPGQVVQVS